MIKSGIYKIYNIVNNDFYIGSSINLRKRISRHFALLKINKHHCTHLQNAVNKYGIDVFSFDIIEYVEDKNLLIEREQYYFDKLIPIYNTDRVAGSRLGSKVSDETKLKLSNHNKGIPQKREGVLKSAKSRTGQKRPNVGAKISIALTGKKHSEETKNKLSLIHSGKKRDPNAVEKARVTMMNKEFIKIYCNENNTIYKSLSDASRKLNLSVSNLCNVLKGKRLKTGGYTFRYA